MQTHGCPYSSCPKGYPECPLLFTRSQDCLPSFIAYVNIFGSQRRRAQGTERAGTSGRAALDRPVDCLELGVS